jgi:hypothetical protein
MTNAKRRWSERRKCRRANCQVAAFIRSDGEKAPCTIVNISDSGAFVESHRILVLGQPVELIISFGEGATELSMTLPGKVARICGNGIGLASPHMDATLLLQLDLMFECDKGDPRQFVTDFCMLAAR